MSNPDDLYFIRQKGGPVKIGRARDARARLATLQIGSPYDLELIGVLSGCGECEAEFHRGLSVNRLRGEWFDWTALVANVINAALAGRDWREMLAEPERVPSHEDWRYGSPLYAGHPVYGGGD